MCARCCFAVCFRERCLCQTPSGITALDGEQCLVVGSSGIHLEPCLEAIAAGDGREVLQLDGVICWSTPVTLLLVLFFDLLLAQGRSDHQCGRRHLRGARRRGNVMFASSSGMSHVGGQACFSCSTGGGAFAMEKCSTSPESGDGRTVFAPTANGQLKMPRLGNYCLTMAGDGASDADVASGAGLVATSSNAEHAVNNLVDGNALSYWASGSDPAAPVDVQLDFGTAKLIKSVEIEWEHPAQVFFLHRACLVVCFACHCVLGPPGIRAASGQRQRVDKHIRHYWQQLGNDCLCGPSCFRLCASDPNDEGGTLVRFIQPWGISLLHFSHTQLLATVADTPCKRIYVCLLMSLRSRAHSSIGQVCHQGRAGCGQLDPRCRARLR